MSESTIGESTTSQYTRGLEQHLQTQIGAGLFGLEDVIHALTIALLARGHILLEGSPGSGKTKLSKAFAQSLGGEFRRIQGTADLMPSDITGVHIYNSRDQTFEFQPGPVFADVVLLDEVNRAGPKTQSALLQAMEEREVSVDRETFSLNENFLVVATQNPQEFEGTFPLPESQLDRFTLCVNVPYLDDATEAKVLRELANLHNTKSLQIEALDSRAIDDARAAVDAIHIADELFAYIAQLASASRELTSVSLGLSTRAALAWTRCARIEAYLVGADFVSPDHVQRVAPWVAQHRLLMSPEAALEGITTRDVLQKLIDQVPVPR